MKIGFVIPWYSAEISGGAEFECRATALKLKESGFDVEVLTTCVKSFRGDWNVNHFVPGVETVEGLEVRRFRVCKSGRDEFHRINRKLMDGTPINVKDERRFLQEMIRSDDLIHYMKKNQDQYIFILIPYMFGTTYDAALACPERAVLLPCLHDESYAYMGVYKEMFRGVRGIIYNSPSEKVLAETLFDIPQGKGILIGMGMDESLSGQGQRFKSKFGVENYLLYVGRKDEGKNVRLLLDYFTAYKRVFPGNLKLVLIGGGKIELSPGDLDGGIVDLGFVSIQDKLDAFAGAMILCNPSLNESFSIVMMESWLSGVPVLVHEKCKVTRDHCTSSQGGLYFGSFEDFVGCVNFYNENPKLREKMGQNGAIYVRSNFYWPKVIEKYRSAFQQWGFDL